MKVVFMAGGKGTRISSVRSDIPKPMIAVDGVPVLEREIVAFKEQGLSDFIITVGHLGQHIIDYFGDGKQLGVHIEYFVEDRPYGNAGALYQIKDQLTDPFLLINGDVIFDVDIQRFIQFHEDKKALVTLFTHPNSHPYDSGLIVTAEDQTVVEWLAKEDDRPQYYQNLVNAGLHILSPKVLEKKVDKEKVDLDRDILKPLAGMGCMYAYKSTEYVHDMGTPERYAQVCKDIGSGLVAAKNYRNPQKAVFLDRDGTINQYVGFLTDIEQFALLPGVADAIKEIHRHGYLAIVVTNQPVVARGEVTFAQLREIHNKMEALLGLEGTYLDGIYVCPHHPNSGFAGEVKELKMKCSCRKPAPGMLLQAAADFNVDLSTSWMIGDSKNDIEAGNAAHCHTALICGTNPSTPMDAVPDLEGGSLIEITGKIFGE